MERYITRQDETLAQITALHSICCTHEAIIAKDAVVQHDMEQLMGYLRISSSESGKRCEKVIHHLNGKIHALVLDHNQDISDFKNSMSNFNQRHVGHIQWPC